MELTRVPARDGLELPVWVTRSPNAKGPLPAVVLPGSVVTVTSGCLSSFVAPYGARLSHKLPKRKLEIGFGVFLLVVSLRFIATLI